MRERVTRVYVVLPVCVRGTKKGVDGGYGVATTSRRVKMIGLCCRI